MKKVLILQNNILHYRKPLYNKLAKSNDITVLHSGNPSVQKEDKYCEIIMPLCKVLKLKFQKGVLKEVNSGKYDVVIAMMDIQWVANVLASFVHKKTTKFAWWGIIASKNNFANRLRGLLLRKKPTIFYTKEGLLKMKKLGFSSPNYTFCNNTFHIENRIPCYLETDKNSFLFVGSLDKRKMLDVVIIAFAKAIPQIPDSITLIIIGEGEELSHLKRLREELKISNRVEFHGKITDTKELSKFYKKALFSVSFGQAGLGVLQSMGYGVPFITCKNAISGGELNNIKDQENGILCENSSESLTQNIIEYGNDFDKCKQLGENAFEHYSNKCTIDQMANKFSKVIGS